MRSPLWFRAVMMGVGSFAAAYAVEQDWRGLVGRVLFVLGSQFAAEGIVSLWPRPFAYRLGFVPRDENH